MLPAPKLFCSPMTMGRGFVQCGHFSSGVARVPCALGQKYFCALSTKTTEFEVKNRRKSAEESKTEHLLPVIF